MNEFCLVKSNQVMIKLLVTAQVSGFQDDNDTYQPFHSINSYNLRNLNADAEPEILHLVNNNLFEKYHFTHWNQ